MSLASLDWLWYSLGAVLGLIGLGLGHLALFHDRSRGRRRCPKCWYSMEGVPGTVCPECGKDAKREARLFKTRRRWAMSFGALAAVAGACLSLRAPLWINHGFMRFIPTTALVYLAPVELKESSGYSFSPTFAERCQSSLCFRFSAGEFWQWQSEAYIRRCIAAKSVDIEAMIRAPKLWLRADAIPVCVRAEGMFPWQLRVHDPANGWTRADTALFASGTEPVVVPVRIEYLGKLLYESTVTRKVRLADSPEHLLSPAPDSVDRIVADLAHPELIDFGGDWHLQIRGERPPLPVGTPAFLIAFHVEVRRGQEVLAVSRSSACDSSVQALTIRNLELFWASDERPSAGASDITLTLVSDLTPAVDLWLARRSQFEAQPELRWVGRIDFPATSTEGSG